MVDAIGPAGRFYRSRLPSINRLHHLLFKRLTVSDNCPHFDLSFLCQSYNLYQDETVALHTCICGQGSPDLLPIRTLETVGSGLLEATMLALVSLFTNLAEGF